MEKCFSCAIKDNRRDNDNYPTHYSISQQLIDKFGFNIDKNLNILEPCCGENDCISKVFKENGYNNIDSYDLNYGSNKKNFFIEDNDEKYDYMITNPPFKNATNFLLKAKQIARKNVIFFLRINFLQGIGRFNNIYNVYDNYRLKHVFQFTRMMDMTAPIREDGKYPTSMLSYAWMIWENGFNGEATLEFINNQKYVLKNDK
jgi:hypothetical protein